jgi:hypothetical protein
MDNGIRVGTSETRHKQWGQLGLWRRWRWRRRRRRRRRSKLRVALS